MSDSEGVAVVSTKKDMCTICFTEELGEAPCIQLPDCRHTFHANCVKKLLEHKWSGLRISFKFLACPTCKTAFSSNHLSNWPQLQLLLDKIMKFRAKIQQMTQKAIAKGMVQASEEGVADANTMEDKCAFYECFECKNPFFGGLADCERDLNMEESVRKEDLVCRKCALKRFGAGQFNCNKHGH